MHCASLSQIADLRGKSLKCQKIPKVTSAGPERADVTHIYKALFGILSALAENCNIEPHC
jgi:hypothetical protein